MSSFADQGTAAHTLLEEALTGIYELGIPIRADIYAGRQIVLKSEKRGDHASLSPSGAKRWMTCAQSPRMAAKYPESLSGERTVTMTREDCQAIQDCLDYIAERVQWIRQNYGPVVVRTERRVSPELFLKTRECDGTSDIALIADRYAEHVDYKHGAGVPVYADDPQNDLYFLGTCAEYASPIMEGAGHPGYGFSAITPDSMRVSVPFDQARLTVVQPRCDKITPRIRFRDITNPSEWFNATVLKVLSAIERTKDENQPFTPSEDACRFCPVGGHAHYQDVVAGKEHGVCKAYTEYCMIRAGVVPPGNFPQSTEDAFQASMQFAQQDVRLLPAPALVGILQAEELLRGMLSAMSGYALELLKNGTAPPELMHHFKMVRGRSNRVYAFDEEETIDGIKKIKVLDKSTDKYRALKKSEMYEEKLKSPKQMEDIFKTYGLSSTEWAAFKRLLTKPEGKIALAPIDDPRDEVKPLRLTAEEAFADIAFPTT